MDKRIKILDDLTASKIAAGEVVQRPASVVKELIENSIDAGASSVFIEVAEGGRRLIRVVDNGEGIETEDAPKAFARHATSKISGGADLDAIRTMGFRGEALHAISSVAKVVMTTRRASEVTGAKVRVEGGGAPKVEDAGCPEGTSVEVTDVFFNTPARKKFMRSARAEFGRVADVVRKAALAYPEVRFTLVHGSSKTLDVPSGGLKERIAGLFGAKVAANLIRVEGPYVEGYVGGPGLSYSTSKAIYTSINGRVVRDPGMNRALIDACAGVIEGGRYPFAVLGLTLPVEDVDVNVHPAKTEVRFKDARLVYDVVKMGVSAALAKGSAGAGATVGSTHPVQTPLKRSERGAYPAPPVPTSGNAKWRASETTADLSGAVRGAPFSPPPTALPPQETLDGFYGDAAGVASPEFASLDTVGLLWGEFLVAQSIERGGEFYLIDTHGAAERCAFEELKKGFYETRSPKSQLLLLPERIETTPEERDSLHSAMEFLKKFGFEILGFGPSTKGGGESFLIKAVPGILSARSPARLARLVLDVAEELGAHGGSSKAEEAVAAALMRIACHSVVRGATSLTKEEGNALLKRLARVDFAQNCPHGRPVVKKFSRREVEAFFRR